MGREPDPEGTRYFLENLASGGLKITEVPPAIRGSEEFQNFVRFSGSMLGFSIHAGRSQFIKRLPKASRIVDLGGTHLARPEGAMYWLGYPYEFSELTIIDLYPDDRHALYKAGLNPERVETDLGPVRYRYHSMTDLSAFGDSSIDLVYSGQSIEQVTPDDGQLVLKGVFRILRPGGHIAIDTPNGRVTPIQQEAFIDSDHEVEYTYPELRELLTGAGFEIASAQGLNLAQRSVATGEFDTDEVAGPPRALRRDRTLLHLVRGGPKANLSTGAPGPPAPVVECEHSTTDHHQHTAGRTHPHGRETGEREAARQRALGHRDGRGRAGRIGGEHGCAMERGIGLVGHRRDQFVQAPRVARWHREVEHTVFVGGPLRPEVVAGRHHRAVRCAVRSTGRFSAVGEQFVRRAGNHGVWLE